MILDHNGLLPCFCHITEAKKYDVVVAREWDFPAGTIIVFDHGYVDYRWFRSLDDRGIFFVTRLKRRTSYSVIEEHPVPQRGGVLRDVTIQLSSRQLKGGLPRAGGDGQRLARTSQHLSGTADTLHSVRDPMLFCERSGLGRTGSSTSRISSRLMAVCSQARMAAQI